MAKIVRPNDDKDKPPKETRKRKDKAALVQYLRGKGIPPGVLQRAQAKAGKALCRDVMGVSDDEYTAAGGTLAEL